MNWATVEEMEYDWNSQFDYQSELAREHRDWAEDCEDPYVQEIDWFPQHDSHVKEWYLHTDHIPF